jgi:copper(I)-binding protein
MIGTVCLVIAALIAIRGPQETVAPAGADFLARPRAALAADPQAWELPDAVPVSLSIRNDGDEDDRLVGGSTPVAQYVAVRRTFLVHGRPATAPAPDGIVIPADATITIEPGTSHLALFALRTDLVQGQTFPLTLQFERAGEVTVIARVRRRVDAAGVAPLPDVSLGDLTITMVSAPPAPGPLTQRARADAARCGGANVMQRADTEFIRSFWFPAPRDAPAVPSIGWTLEGRGRRCSPLGEGGASASF